MSSPELEPLASIAVAAEIAADKIREAWQPVADAGIELSKRLRSDVRSDG